MLPIQILMIGFSVFAIVRTIRQFQKGTLPANWLSLWVFFWIGVSIVVLLPQTTDLLARLTGVGRGADVVVYSAIPALFYLVFRLYVKMEKIEREITTLVRKNALEKIQKDF